MSFRPRADIDSVFSKIAKTAKAIWTGGTVTDQSEFMAEVIFRDKLSAYDEVILYAGLIVSGQITGDTLTISGEITGETLDLTVADGTAPITTISTTKVDNLNVDQVDEYHATPIKTASSISVSDTNGYLDSWITFNLPIRRAWFGA